MKGKILALVKPQFELGPEGEHVVRDPKKHELVREKLTEFFRNQKLKILGWTESPIPGAKGNREFFAYLQKDG